MLCGEPHIFRKVGRRGSSRLLLEAFQVGSHLDTVDADFACRRKFDWARLIDERSGLVVVGRGCTEQSKLVFLPFDTVLDRDSNKEL